MTPIIKFICCSFGQSCNSRAMHADTSPVLHNKQAEWLLVPDRLYRKLMELSHTTVSRWKRFLYNGAFWLKKSPYIIPTHVVALCFPTTSCSFWVPCYIMLSLTSSTNYKTFTLSFFWLTISAISVHFLQCTTSSPLYTPCQLKDIP